MTRERPAPTDLLDPPDERAEWMESVDGLVAAGGPEAAARILAEVAAHARRRGVVVDVHPSYRNTIPVELTPDYPGDLALEERIDAHLRWNAMAMVVRANKHQPGLSGHLSTYASTLTLWEVGFQHFFRGRGQVDGPVTTGDQVFLQGHASPGVYARAFLEDRLDAQQLDLFRREVAGAGRGLPSYPHPHSMGEFWEFPTVSLGIGPLHAVYQAWFNRYLAARGLADTTDARVWCFLGDGETDEPETLAAIRLAAREHLDNLTVVVNGHLQRLDGPVRGNTRILDELEGVFTDVGWHVIKVLWASEWASLFAAPGGGQLLDRLETMNDGDLLRLTILDAAELRETLFGGAEAPCGCSVSRLPTRSCSGCAAEGTTRAASTPHMPTPSRTAVRSSAARPRGRRHTGDAVSDYVSALPDTLARFTGGSYLSVGTDDYSLSDTREELRAHFGTDAPGITAAALGLLAQPETATRSLVAVPTQSTTNEQLGVA